jgi:hypothetical protein
VSTTTPQEPDDETRMCSSPPTSRDVNAIPLSSPRERPARSRHADAAANSKSLCRQSFNGLLNDEVEVKKLELQCDSHQSGMWRSLSLCLFAESLPHADGSQTKKGVQHERQATCDMPPQDSITLMPLITGWTGTFISTRRIPLALVQSLG